MPGISGGQVAFLGQQGTQNLMRTQQADQQFMIQKKMQEKARLDAALENEKQSLGHPSYPLIFDPQTSGGPLASVPAGQAEECVLKLRAKGFLDTCVIGAVQADGLDFVSQIVELGFAVSFQC
jgi:hypothetical protein